MQSFYQPHVREPGFLALTRAALWSLDWQDAGVSLASAAGSVLAVFATYLLGAALLSRAAGLLASLMLAIEFEAITWAPDGWRDDTFMATVLLAAWGLLRLHQSPSFQRALLAGALCGLACLTRITALTFILPAFVWLALAAPRAQRAQVLRHVGVALFATTALVAPYLISCAIATGDPFYALNYHTLYYRHAAGMDTSQPMSAAAYLRSRLASLPAATIDTGFVGLFVQPFVTKWNGLDHWISGLGTVAGYASLAGVAMLPFTPNGRLLLMILLTSLLPYTFSWNLAGGGEWRFTMHAYPIYLAAGAAAIVGAINVVIRSVRQGRQVSRDEVVRNARRVAAIGVVAVTGALLYFSLPWLVVREAIAAGTSTSIETGARDRVFYRTGWSPPHLDGLVVRVSTAARSAIYFPLPARRSYDLVLRVDPVAPEARQRADVLFNGRLVGRLDLNLDPERVGSYRVHLPEEAVRVGRNELEILAAPTIAAAARFAWLEPETRIGVRLWYVRVIP